MHIRWLNLLRSPASGSNLILRATKSKGDIIYEGELIDSKDSDIVFPIYEGIANFTGEHSYADSFGIQ